MADNSAVLQNRKHVKKAIVKTSARAIKYDGPTAAEILKANEDESKFEWVEVPDTDLFGEEHTGVSVNFDAFTPGKYFVSPELASEIKRLLRNRELGDRRVLQPRQDVRMAQIMAKSQLGAPVNPDLVGLNDR